MKKSERKNPKVRDMKPKKDAKGGDNDIKVGNQSQFSR